VLTRAPTLRSYNPLWNASAQNRMKMVYAANMIKPKCVANVSLQLVLCANLGGGQKLANYSQPFVDKVYQILGHVEKSLQIDKFLSDC